jgi:hypothetical protein
MMPAQESENAVDRFGLGDQRQNFHLPAAVSVVCFTMPALRNHSLEKRGLPVVTSLRDRDSPARAASDPHAHGLQLSGLESLQDGLLGDAEGAGRSLERQPALGSVGCEEPAAVAMLTVKISAACSAV